MTTGLVCRILTPDMETLTLAAKSRTATGRGVKGVRTAGELPGVLYGHGVEPHVFSVPAAEFRKVYAKAGSSSLVDVSFDGGAPVKAVIHEVQPHPLTMEPLHVDLYQVRMDEKMTARIPLVFTGESDAVKTLGGSLVKSLDSVEVDCLPADLPHELSVDLSALKTFEDDITVADLPVPQGVTVTTDAKLTIATVTPPLTEEQLKKMEESQLGDVGTVKSEADEKKAEGEAAEGEGEAKPEEKKDDEQKSE